MTYTSKGFYIGPSEADGLNKFQYNGADNSLIYAYILKPLANYLVKNVVPRSIAPNSITLFGLAWMITSYCILCYYCPSLDSGNEEDENTSFPNWVFLFNAVAMLVYQTLDNMDGVQARRTGSSSPLGLLFDHGCDAFNIVLGSTNWMCAVGIGVQKYDFWIMVIMIFIPMILFFISTWEEYYTGKLVLPIINGPTEGLILGACQMIISGVWGVNFWHQYQFYEQFVSPFIIPYIPQNLAGFIPDTGLTNLEIQLIVTIVLAVQEIVLKLTFVTRKYGIQTLFSLTPMMTITSFTMLMGVKTPEILTRNPRVFMNLLSALFVEMVTALMLDHMTLSIYQAYRKTLIPLIILVFLGTHIDEWQQDLFVYSYASSMFVFLGFKIRLIIHELCSTLGIWCFDIVTPFSGSIGDGHVKEH